MAALWLYSGLAGATDAERFWRELIGQQTGLTVPALARGEITVPMARLVLLRASLPLEFSLSFFSLIRQGPVSQAASRPKL